MVELFFCLFLLLIGIEEQPLISAKLLCQGIVSRHLSQGHFLMARDPVVMRVNLWVTTGAIPPSPAPDTRGLGQKVFFCPGVGGPAGCFGRNLQMR